MVDFNEREERVLAFWEKNDIFQKSMDAREKDGAKPFVVFEGPPFANGNPGIHHFIGRVFKDLICRYQTMRGRFVLRKGGWDTHGLPVELQVEKELGFTSKKDIEKFGVAEYNKKCRESVWKYKEEWDRFTKRIGYWVDLQHPYITYETPYIESLWNILQQFNERKLLYEAHRVVPFCTRCGTPLSNHEVAQGYKTITDTSVIVKFKVKSEKVKVKGVLLPKNTLILVWTTTPWTLPGNVALAVGEDIQYVLAKKGDEYFVIAADLANKVLGAPLAIEQEFTGKELVGLSYEPLFSVRSLKKPKSYKIYAGDFVTTTDGTGIVHIAPMYGEDDYRLGQIAGLPLTHTVTEQGTFTGVSKDLDGLYVKSSKAEKLILDYLTTHHLQLITSPYQHDYPFCWRCATPLLYYAKNSWFVRVSALKEQMLENNKTVRWTPAHLKEGRFGQWLRDARDWNISRERYWGTPLPIWRSKNGKQSLVIGSLDDLDAYRVRKANTYWLMRHGQATKNVAGIIDSDGVSQLTDLGKRQAEESAKTLKKKMGRKKIDLLIASPALRAQETAAIIASVLGVKKITTDERLKEIQLGPSLEGCHSSKYHEAYPTYRDKFLQRPPGGESVNDLRERQWGLLCELEEKYAGKNILVVGHEYPLWAMTDIATGWSREQSIAEKERRGDDFVGFAGIEQVTVRNRPRDDHGTVDLHRPYVDQIVLKKGKTLLYRIPEIADVWFDSGAMPYAQWHWPFENDDVFRSQFPADFIGEGIDQTRGWFYTLLAIATALGKGAPYQSVLSYGHVLDGKGQKMSKSKGNIVKPDEVIGEVGVDAARWYFYTLNNPGDSKLFAMREVRERLTGFMGTLENCVKFWELYADRPEARNFSHGNQPTHLLDRWVLSRLHGLVRLVTEKLDGYDLTTAARAIETFVVDDLSQWWLRRSRKRLEALGFLRHVLLEVDKLIAPFVPFAAEDLHQRLHVGTAPSTESVHLHDWPTFNAASIDEGLEEQMGHIREYVTAGLAIRKQEQIKVRQPLASITVPSEPFPADLEILLKDELNVKEVRHEIGQSVLLNLNITNELRAEGWAREALRAIQEMRKEAGLQVGDKARCQWSASERVVRDAITTHRETVVREAGLSDFVEQADTGSLAIERRFDLAPGHSIWMGLEK